MAILLCWMGFNAAAQDYTIQNNEVKIAGDINFKTGTAVLLPGSEEALIHIKKYLEDKKYISLLRVEAHTAAGTEGTDHQQLSQQRAAAICQKLIAMGVDCMRLLPVGFGDTKPVAANDTPAGRAQNTRINFVNASLAGKPIGGMPVDGGGVVAENPCY